MNKPTNKQGLPADIRPFDFNRDERLVIAYAAKTEDSLFGFAHDLKSSCSKAMGVRVDYDVIRVYSLRDPSHDDTVMTLSVTHEGSERPIHRHSIAGVSGDMLWFEMAEQFMSAEAELELKRDMQNDVVAALGGDLMGFLRQMMEGGGPEESGEEWKK
jgi:hypothetical protein